MLKEKDLLVPQEFVQVVLQDYIVHSLSIHFVV